MNKICTKCGENKALEEYYRNTSTKDGKMLICKSCIDAGHTKYYEIHKQKIKKYQDNYYKTYRKTNEGKLAITKAHTKYDKSDKGKLIRAEYAKSDKGKVNQAKASIKYDKTEKGKLAAARKDHNRRIKISNTLNDLTIKEFNCILFLQQYKCACCGGYFDKVKPQKDHINPVELGGPFTKENVQVLCKSCNSSKGAQYVDYRSTIHKQIIKTV